MSCRRRPHPPSHADESASAVAIVMDGNSRWAARRGLSVAEGHRAGSTRVAPGRRDVDRPRHRIARRVRLLDGELDAPGRGGQALMEIFGETIDRELADLAKEGVRTRFVGRRDRAPEWLQAKLAELERATESETAAQPLDRVRLRRPRRDRRSRTAARRERLSRSTRSRSRATCTSPTCRTRMSSCGRRARCASRTSCSGSSRTPSSSSPTSSGRTSVPDDLRAAVAEYARRRRRFGGR